MMEGVRAMHGIIRPRRAGSTQKMRRKKTLNLPREQPMTSRRFRKSVCNRMAEQCLLIADADTGTWDEARQALGASWIVVGAASCEAAAAAVEKHPCAVVVANYNLPDGSGPELLNRLRASNPKTVRFIAADPALKDQVMSQVLGGDLFLPLPYEYANFKPAIEHSQVDDYGMSDNVRDLVARIRTFPTIPSLYLEVVNALKNTNATTDEIGAIIARDMSMTTKLLQVLNSAYFGLPRTITDPTEAVSILGFETVKSLIVAVKLLNQYDKIKPAYFSMDNIWRHSNNVARTARVMALLETDDPVCSATAYTAGLMHDLGKVILAANFDDQYNKAHCIARKQRIPLWKVEKDIFGATHGEIGAHLLALCGMSPDVVKVAALHHEPIHSGDAVFTPLTAVHVANALEYEGVFIPDGLPASTFDLSYLQQLGMADRVELWRFARREPDATKHDTRMLYKKTAAKSAPVTPAVGGVPPQSSPPPRDLAKLWPWLGVGLGTAASIVVILLMAAQKIEMAAASSTPAGQKAARVIAPSASIPASPAPRIPGKTAANQANPKRAFSVPGITPPGSTAK
jgi:putative nucleotidyltransferase with HDIG domain